MLAGRQPRARERELLHFIGDNLAQLEPSSWGWRRRAARMARELAAVRVVAIGDCAHDLTVEQPAGLAAAIERFTDAG